MPLSTLIALGNDFLPLAVVVAGFTQLPRWIASTSAALNTPLRMQAGISNNASSNTALALRVTACALALGSDATAWIGAVTLRVLLLANFNEVLVTRR